ncbi:hypothetical protein EBZ38_09410 [bacterium]|nr:hypothetical protein [bacterium]
MIITTHKKYLILRCAERGYSLDEVMPCVIQVDGDMWTIDTDHANYPRATKILNNIQTEDYGVGTELKKILKMIGITASPTCSCNARAKIMNENGIKWCEENIYTILGWLKEEANKRNLPFSSYLATSLINLAIKKAKKTQNKQNA